MVTPKRLRQVSCSASWPCYPGPKRLHSPLGVKHSLPLQDLGEHGNGRVDRVGDDQDERLGTSFGDGFSEGGTDSGVDLEVDE